MKRQQEELESRRCKVDRLKREQEELVLERERLCAGQEQLDRSWVEQEQQMRLRIEQQECGALSGKSPLILNRST